MAASLRGRARLRAWEAAARGGRVLDAGYLEGGLFLQARDVGIPWTDSLMAITLRSQPLLPCYAPIFLFA